MRVLSIRAIVRAFSTAVIVIAGGVSAALAQVPAVSDLSVLKTGPATAAANTDVSFTITITNLGPDDSSPVTLTDNITGGWTFVSLAAAAGFSCSNPGVGNAGLVTCTAPTLPAASGSNTATFTLVLHIPTGTPLGTVFTNIANISAATDPNPENDSSTAVTIIPAPQADVFASKSGPPFGAAGSNVTFTITTGNVGPDPAVNFSLTDTLPGTMTFVSLGQSGTVLSCATPAPGSGGTITCSAPSYPAGGSTVLTLVGQIPGGTTSGTVFPNTATVTSSTEDPNPANNSSTTDVVVQSADVAVTKTGPATATAGTNVTYTITVSNGGPDQANNVTLTDPLPAGSTFVTLTQNTGPLAVCSTPLTGSGGTVICNFAMILNTESAQFSLTVVIGNPPSASNTATVSSDTPDPNGANNTATATTTVTPAPTDVAIVKTAAPALYATGFPITYNITVTNNGPAFAVGVTVTDVLPAGMTFVSATPSQGSCSGTTTVTCTLGTLASSASATIVLTATLPSTPGPVANMATVTMTNTDTNPANNSSTATVTVISAGSIPALSPVALALLALFVAATALLALRR